MRSRREIAEERGMTVGARDERLRLKSVGVRLEREKGVVDRGGSKSGLLTAVGGDAAAMYSLSTPGVVER